MTKDLKDLVDNIHQLAMNSRDISAVSRMVGTIHAVDEALLVLTRERDEANFLVRRILSEINCRIDRGADSNGHLEGIYELFKKEETQ